MSTDATAIDAGIRSMVEDAYMETADEALDRGASLLVAHKEATTAAAMLLAAMSGMEDEAAIRAVVALGLRPSSDG